MPHNIHAWLYGAEGGQAEHRTMLMAALYEPSKLLTQVIGMT